MFTRIIQLLQRNRKSKIFFLGFCFALLSLFPIFRNFYYSNGILTYERHIAILEKRSEFYNPWQYRILCPGIVEGMMWVYNNTIDKIYPIEQKFAYTFNATSAPTEETLKFFKLLNTKGAIKYLIIFIFFRFVEHLLIFLLAYVVWSYFIRNNWLIFFGLIFLTLAMGNSIAAADLAFNTYMDNILYLLTACIILYRKSPLWLLAIVPLGALNRETSIMIPFLYFISQMDFKNLNLRSFRFSHISFPPKKVWFITALAYVIFFVIFFSLRIYFGYREPQMWKVPSGLPMLKLNLLSPVAFKAYFEMIGTFGVIPFIILYVFRRFPHILKLWFIAIVPVWFFVHEYTVVTYQTRLFLVPIILVFLPMMLWLIENEARKSLTFKV
ncbi:MAG: hypothetical protein WKF97_00020 [Chitinophagaceae bacterium]